LKKNKVATELLIWYENNKRDLPWRQDRNPYRIWLSEIILQQTRVDQGLPYYLKFTELYPTIHHLANASEDKVLRVWQGLGYYSRAKNLHKCAKIIVEKYNGKFPSSRDELITLPGIGLYTSAAIASFAFKKKEAVVDGNVIRVITRLYGIDGDITNQKTLNQIKSIADELIPSTHPDLFNQAIMEFGALYCTPKNPLCESCRFISLCDAQIKGEHDNIPFKPRKLKKRIRFFNYFLFEFNDKVLLRKRIGKDIWNGLFEFYLIETDIETSLDSLEMPKTLARYPNDWEIVTESKMYKHLLSHQTIMCRFYKVLMHKEFKYNPVDWTDYQLYSKKEILDLPKSILIDRYLGEKII